MSLYAIGDLHLSFSVDKSMDVWGGVWVNHEQKIVEQFNREIKPEDTLVLVGDHSWGRNMQECRKDFAFIENLPGRKILTRGNHDMFWDSGAAGKLNAYFNGKLEFLQGGYLTYQDYALVATKGYCYEGKDTMEHAEKLVNREAARLKAGFEKAKNDGYQKFIMFLHYPPTNIMETRTESETVFTRMAEEYGAEQVVYAHCHGAERFHDSYRGMFHGVKYTLVSGDCLDWHPAKILD